MAENEVLRLKENGRQTLQPAILLLQLPQTPHVRLRALEPYVHFQP